MVMMSDSFIFFSHSRAARAARVVGVTTSKQRFERYAIAKHEILFSTGVFALELAGFAPKEIFWNRSKTAVFALSLVLSCCSFSALGSWFSRLSCGAALALGSRSRLVCRSRPAARSCAALVWFVVGSRLSLMVALVCRSCSWQIPSGACRSRGSCLLSAHAALVVALSWLSRLVVALSLVPLMVGSWCRSRLSWSALVPLSFSWLSQPLVALVWRSQKRE